MVNCSKCSAPPASLPDVFQLYLLPPVGHSAKRFHTVMARMGELFDAGLEGLLAVRFDSTGLMRCAEELGTLMTPTELEDARALLLAEGEEPRLADLMRMEPLNRWIARSRARYITELIDDGGLFSHFQPIVYSRDPNSVFAYECLLRGRSKQGTVIPPLEIYRDARAAGLLFPLDRAARLTAIAESVRHGIRGRLFINFNPSSIYDPETCLRSTVAAITEVGLPPGRVTFEIVESEQVDPSRLAKIVQYYRSAGFRVALDDLGAGYSSLNLLNVIKPDYVKLDRELVSGVDLDPYKACIAAPLLTMAHDLGIETVAEGVETEGELDWLRARGVDYLQGFLIARPGLPPFRLNRPGMVEVDRALQEAGEVPLLRVAE